MKYKNLNDELDNLLSSLNLPSEEEIKNETKSEKIKNTLRGTKNRGIMIEGNRRGGNKAKESGQLKAASKKGGESMRDSGKLAQIRSLPKELPYTTTSIVAINKKTLKEIKFISQHEASRILNLPVGNINQVLTNKGRKSVGGYTFRYADQ